MKNLFILSLLLMFVSCEPQPNHSKKLTNTNDFKTIRIDGCQYLIKSYEVSDLGYEGYGFGYFSHKGNCDNICHSFPTEHTNNSDEIETEGETYYFND